MRVVKVIESTKAGAVVAGSSCLVDDFFSRLAANDDVLKAAQQSGISIEAAKALFKVSGRLVKIFRPVHFSE